MRGKYRYAREKNLCFEKIIGKIPVAREALDTNLWLQTYSTKNPYFWMDGWVDGDQKCPSIFLIFMYVHTKVPFFFSRKSLKFAPFCGFSSEWVKMLFFFFRRCFFFFPASDFEWVSAVKLFLGKKKKNICYFFFPGCFFFFPLTTSEIEWVSDPQTFPGKKKYDTFAPSDAKAMKNAVEVQDMRIYLIYLFCCTFPKTFTKTQLLLSKFKIPSITFFA